MDHNSLPELVELMMRVVKKEEDSDERKVNVELRVNPAEIDGPDNLSITVAIKKLSLNLDITGLSLCPGSRHGELLKPNIEVHERAIKTETSFEGVKKGGIAVKVDANPALNMDASGSQTAKTTNSVSLTEKLEHVRVRARGNKTWEVTEPAWQEVKHLDAKYLNDEPLCNVTSISGANARTVQLSTHAKQKDLILDAKKPGFLKFRSTNHERLMKVLIGKAISGNSEAFGGIVTFSNSEVDLED